MYTIQFSTERHTSKPDLYTSLEQHLFLNENGAMLLINMKPTAICASNGISRTRGSFPSTNTYIPRWIKGIWYTRLGSESRTICWWRSLWIESGTILQRKWTVPLVTRELICHGVEKKKVYVVINNPADDPCRSLHARCWERLMSVLFRSREFTFKVHWLILHKCRDEPNVFNFDIGTYRDHDFFWKMTEKWSHDRNIRKRSRFSVEWDFNLVDKSIWMKVTEPRDVVWFSDV